MGLFQAGFTAINKMHNLDSIIRVIKLMMRYVRHVRIN
jgi:hypothetical protein